MNKFFVFLITNVLLLQQGFAQGPIDDIADFLQTENQSRLTSREIIEDVNRFVNEHIQYKKEPPGEDYWQSPLESSFLGTGDCEDYAIYKFYLLWMLGAQGGQLRLLHNQVLQNGIPSWHMVLLVYNPKYPLESLVLDNITDDILPLRQRLSQDMRSVEFSLDTQDVYKEVSATKLWGGNRLQDVFKTPQMMSLTKFLVKRMRENP